MITNKHQVNYDIIPENLQAQIIKVNIDGYTRRAMYLISIPEINFEYWSHESNIISWHEFKDLTDKDNEIIQAGKERARQIRKYYDGEISISEIDKNNPLKKLNL